MGEIIRIVYCPESRVFVAFAMVAEDSLYGNRKISLPAPLSDGDPVE